MFRKIAFWQFVWVWPLRKWDIGFDRVYYEGYDEVGIYFLIIGPLRVGAHMALDDDPR